ncbi:MAG TPA: helix-turn-helix transcriptional regulator [Limnobacter sp.]|nr:helix-turn-helix transcriptional regulator [Limnobacter sp.]
MSEQEPLPEFLTTKEVAELLRLKERKVYELASTQEIPCLKATGKLLFPKKELMHWLQTGELVQPSFLPHSPSNMGEIRPAVLAGSSDPLLEWAIRESGCGLAMHLDGSLKGLELFELQQASLTGLHVPNANDGHWNVGTVAPRFAGKNVVLVRWAWRQQGLVVAAGNPLQIASLTDLRGKRLAVRQSGAGGMILLGQLLRRAGMHLDELSVTESCRTDHESIAAVASGNADAAPGLEALTRLYGLGFVPTQMEAFDLLVCRKAWFDSPIQTLMRFAGSETFKAKARQMAGYDTGSLGQVIWSA